MSTTYWHICVYKGLLTLARWSKSNAHSMCIEFGSFVFTPNAHLTDANPMYIKRIYPWTWIGAEFKPDRNWMHRWITEVVWQCRDRDLTRSRGKKGQVWQWLLCRLLLRPKHKSLCGGEASVQDQLDPMKLVCLLVSSRFLIHSHLHVLRVFLWHTLMYIHRQTANTRASFTTLFSVCMAWSHMIHWCARPINWRRW